MSLIEQLKHNEKPYGLNTKEEQERFRGVGKKNCQWAGSFGWEDDSDEGNHFFTFYTYRIRADYQLEPQTERCEVFTEHLYHNLRYIRKGRTWACLHEALSDPDFMYFEFEDGFKSLSPRLAIEGDRSKPAPIPKWVLFVKRSE